MQKEKLSTADKILRKFLTDAINFGGPNHAISHCPIGKTTEEQCLDARVEGCWCEAFEAWRSGPVFTREEWESRFSGSPARCDVHSGMPEKFLNAIVEEFFEHEDYVDHGRCFYCHCAARET